MPLYTVCHIPSKTPSWEVAQSTRSSGTFSSSRVHYNEPDLPNVPHSPLPTLTQHTHMHTHCATCMYCTCTCNRSPMIECMQGQTHTCTHTHEPTSSVLTRMTLLCCSVRVVSCWMRNWYWFTSSWSFAFLSDSSRSCRYKFINTRKSTCS